MKVVVVGLGEIGRPLYELLVEGGVGEVYGYDIDESKSVHRLEDVPVPVDVVHVAFPFSERFVNNVVGYFERLRPRLIIVHSTVAPGTTRKIHELTGALVAYSPVRGKHPFIKKHLRFWVKWVAGVPREAGVEVARHLESIGLRVRVVDSPETLELAKLFETVYRALMIVFWQEAHRVARRFGADIVSIAEFIGEVHEVLRDRPVYYPAYIGGHCLIPNTRILAESSPSPLWDYILDSNERRRRELEDPVVREEIERVKKLVWERLVNRDYYEGRVPAGPGRGDG